MLPLASDFVVRDGGWWQIHLQQLAQLNAEIDRRLRADAAANRDDSEENHVSFPAKEAAAFAPVPPLSGAVAVGSPPQNDQPQAVVAGLAPWAAEFEEAETGLNLSRAASSNDQQCRTPRGRKANQGPVSSSNTALAENLGTDKNSKDSGESVNQLVVSIFLVLFFCPMICMVSSFFSKQITLHYLHVLF